MDNPFIINHIKIISKINKDIYRELFSVQCLNNSICHCKYYTNRKAIVYGTKLTYELYILVEQTTTNYLISPFQYFGECRCDENGSESIDDPSFIM